MDANDPVFPAQELNAQGMPISHMVFGLTKRELFAAMAMQGLIASMQFGEELNEARGARWSIQCADALIAELSKGGL